MKFPLQPQIQSKFKSSQSRLTEEGMITLCDALRTVARSVHPGRFFWERFAEKLESGACPLLDLKEHYKKPKSIEEITENIYKILAPERDFKSIHKDDLRACLLIVKQVKKDLDY